MQSKSSAIQSLGLLILRVSFGCFMLVHGWPKLMEFQDRVDTFPDPLGMGSQLSLISAVSAEVGCSVLLILGLCTRLAAIPLAFTMFVALFLIHGADPWQKKELAAMYLAVYSALVFTGPGCFSVDALLFGRSKSTSTDGTAET